MSDAHNEQQSAIKTPKQLLAAVAGFFLVTVIGIILLVQFVTAQKLTGAGTESQSPEAIAERLSPVANAGFTFKDCTAVRRCCKAAKPSHGHLRGLPWRRRGRAPKFGDAGSWSARLAQGYDTVLKHAIEGLRAMPAKGGNPDLDDVEVARAVVYIANASGGKFKEPEVPAPAAAADGAGAPAQEAKK